MQPLGMLGLNPFGAAGPVIKLQPFMPKASDHRLNVTYVVTTVKQRICGLLWIDRKDAAAPA